MTELVSFDLDGGGRVVVELAAGEPGVELAGREDGLVARARVGFEEAMGDVRRAAMAAMATLRDGLDPDELRLEFGVRLNAQAGAVLARTSLEGHLHVVLTWKDQAGVPDG